MNETLDMSSLKDNLNPGFGVVIGLDETGKNIYELCFMTSTTPENRDRVYVFGDAGYISTESIDKTRAPKNSTFTMYDAMAAENDRFVAGNGNHTRDVLHSFASGLNAQDALYEQRYESDYPIATPRITGICSLEEDRPIIEMMIVRKSRWGNLCDRNFYARAVEPGVGYCLTAYMGDDDPPTPFQGEPFLVPLCGAPKDVIASFWAALDSECRIAIVIKSIDLKTQVQRAWIHNRCDEKNEVNETSRWSFSSE